MTSETSDENSVDFDPNGAASIAARSGLVQPDGLRYVPYRYDEAGEIALHVRIALATSRPILLSGPPGSGKSTLARDVALCLGRRYYERVITSRTQARDLQWRWDAVGRLADIQGKKAWLDTPSRFVEPEVLWWAFAPTTAATRGHSTLGENAPPPLDPYWGFLRDQKEVAYAPGAVILLDEIDKADPDVPNDLLAALGERRFIVEETHDQIDPETDLPALIFITTNGERELPQAFLRRCITLKLELPTGDVMKDVLRRHVQEVDEDVLSDLVSRHELMVAHAGKDDSRPPGTAELIDAVRAATRILHRYDAALRQSVLDRLLKATLWKRDEAMPSPPAPGAPG